MIIRSDRSHGWKGPVTGAVVLLLFLQAGVMAQVTEKWVAKYNGKSVPARTPGDGELDAIEDAPGSFVKVRAD